MAVAKTDGPGATRVNGVHTGGVATPPVAPTARSEGDSPFGFIGDPRIPQSSAPFAGLTFLFGTPILVLLNSPNPIIVSAALHQLVDRYLPTADLVDGSESAVSPSLAGIVLGIVDTHENPMVRGLALRTAMALDSERALPKAIAIITDVTAPESLRAMAITQASSGTWILPGTPPEGVALDAATAIVKLLNSPNEAIQIAALNALPKLGTVGSSQLSTVVEMALVDDKTEVTREALTTIRSLVRSPALQGSLELGGVESKMVSVLLDVHFNNWYEALNVAEAMGTHGIPALQSVITSSDLSVGWRRRRCQDAIRTLVAIGEPAVPTIVDLLSNDVFRQEVTGIMLPDPRRPSSVPLLLALMDRPEVSVRSFAAQRLHQHLLGIPGSEMSAEVKIEIAQKMAGYLADPEATTIFTKVANSHAEGLVTALVRDLKLSDPNSIDIREALWFTGDPVLKPLDRDLLKRRAVAGLTLMGERALPLLHHHLNEAGSGRGFEWPSESVEELRRITQTILEAHLEDIRSSSNQRAGREGFLATTALPSKMRLLTPQQLEALALKGDPAIAMAACSVLREMGLPGSEALVRLRTNAALPQSVRQGIDTDLRTMTAEAVRAWEIGAREAVGADPRLREAQHRWERPSEILRAIEGGAK